MVEPKVGPLRNWPNVLILAWCKFLKFPTLLPQQNRVSHMVKNPEYLTIERMQEFILYLFLNRTMQAQEEHQSPFWANSVPAPSCNSLVIEGEGTYHP